MQIKKEPYKGKFLGREENDLIIDWSLYRPDILTNRKEYRIIEYIINLLKINCHLVNALEKNNINNIYCYVNIIFPMIDN